MRVQLDDGDPVELDTERSTSVPWPFDAVRAGAEHTVRVAVRGEDGPWSPWSRPVRFSTALREGEWTAEFIGAAADSPAAAPLYARQEFTVASAVRRATLYATAHGVYQVSVNGADVDDHLFKPGWTAYRQRLAYEATDVTALVRVGRNAIGVRAAGGWYTEKYGFGETARRHYGSRPEVSAELRIEYADGRAEVIRTDAEWRVSSHGELVSSGLYAGETIDARRRMPGWDRPDFDDTGWQRATASAGTTAPRPVDVEPVRRIEERAPVAHLRSPSGRDILDFGQNLVGRVRMRVQGARGTTVVLRHAEVLEDGELCTRPLRAAASTDRFVLAGDAEEVFEPEFTFHGFRYVEVTGWPGPVQADRFRAVVIHTDMVRTGWFRSSDELLDRLHENVVWGLRGNALALPTDCPQRDERLGWTGDAQVFAPSAASLFDVDALFASWLEDLGLEQDAAGGRVPTVVPDVLGELSAVAAAGWGDAATVIPSVLYERYGDDDVLRTQLPSMRAWADAAWAAAGDSGLWERGFQYGDWLDPTASRPDKAKTDPGLVATAYLYRSTRLVADALTAVGDEASARRYAERAATVRDAFTRTYVTSAGRVMSDAPTAYALTLTFGLVDDPTLRGALAARLAHLLRAGGYRMATGFLGTPIVLDALVDNGFHHAAEQLLFQTLCPSWLYPVTMGATTPWERWDSLLPDGSVNPSGMTSFNHYALGSVVDVLHRRVAGLAPGAPGYRRLIVAPWFVSRLRHAEVVHDTPHGRAVVAWERDSAGGTVRVRVQVPTGAVADIRLGDGTEMEVAAGTHEWTRPDPARSPGAPLSVGDDMAEIADRGDACAVVSRTLAEHDAGMAAEFDAFARWVPGRPLRQELAAVAAPAVVVERIDARLRAATTAAGGAR